MIVQGTVTVPGDKSITHRLLLLAALGFLVTRASPTDCCCSRRSLAGPAKSATH